MSYNQINNLLPLCSGLQQTKIKSSQDRQDYSALLFKHSDLVLLKSQLGMQLNVEDRPIVVVVCCSSTLWPLLMQAPQPSLPPSLGIQE